MIYTLPKYQLLWVRCTFAKVKWVSKLHHGGAKDWVSMVKSLHTSSSLRWLPHLWKAKCRNECMHMHGMCDSAPRHPWSSCALVINTAELQILDTPTCPSGGRDTWKLKTHLFAGFWYAQTSFWFEKKNHFRIVFSFIIFHISDLKMWNFKLCV